MWKSRTLKGFSLIEVIIALAIYSILFFTALSIYSNNIRLKSYNKTLTSHTSYIEALKNIIIYTSDFSTISSLCDGNVRFINKNNLSLHILKEKSLDEIITPTYDGSNTFISVTGTIDKVLRLELVMNINIFGRNEVLQCIIYKGNY